MAEFQLGSISTGTLRTQDLLEAFHSTIAASGTPPALAEDGYIDGGARYSDGELLEVYTEQLESLCPPFVYFGTHPGDGADFGFWPDMDRLNEEIQWVKQTPASDEVVLDDNDPNNPIIVHVSDHGNVTVMDMERNVLWSVV